MDAQYQESVPHLIEDTLSRQGECQYWFFLKYGLPARDLGCRPCVRRDGYPWDLLDHREFLQPIDVFMLRHLREGQTKSHLQHLWSEIRQKECVLEAMRARSKRLVRDNLDEAHQFYQAQLLRRRHAIIKLALETKMPVDPFSKHAFIRACNDVLDEAQHDVVANPRPAICARLQVLAPGSDIARWTTWHWVATRDLATGNRKSLPMVVQQASQAANTGAGLHSPALHSTTTTNPATRRADVAAPAKATPASATPSAGGGNGDVDMADVERTSPAGEPAAKPAAHAALVSESAALPTPTAAAAQSPAEMVTAKPTAHANLSHVPKDVAPVNPSEGVQVRIDPASPVGEASDNVGPVRLPHDLLRRAIVACPAYIGQPPARPAYSEGGSADAVLTGEFWRRVHWLKKVHWTQPRWVPQPLGAIRPRLATVTRRWLKSIAPNQTRTALPYQQMWTLWQRRLQHCSFRTLRPALRLL